MNEEIIDLTNSVTYTTKSNNVIELDSDEDYKSSHEQSISNDTKRRQVYKRLIKSTCCNLINNNQLPAKSATSSRTKDSNKPNSWGGCAVCWEQLGRNPLASTKCGHVYCMKCLEKCLKIEKKCPTCRQSLKGSSAYHPLFLTL